MHEVLKIGDCNITAAEILPLLVKYRLLPQFCREVLIDQAIADISCTAEETAIAYEQYINRNQLTTAEALQTWLERHGMTTQELADLAVRELKIEKFKRATWEAKLESYFLKVKSRFDKVIYSLIRTKDVGLAQELYFRIEGGEQTLAELARDYSQGPEAQTGGLIGPVELGTPHPALAQMLATSQPGQLWPPTRVGEWLVIVRLEKLIPAELDELMRQQLLQELFENWLRDQLSQLKLDSAQQSLSTLS